MIVHALHEKQDARGYLTPDDMRSVAENLRVPLHRVNAVVSFFPHFRTTPPPTVDVHICRDMSCHLNGSVAMTERLSQWAAGKYSSDDVKVCGVSCLGRCDRAPAAMVNERLVASANDERLQRAVHALLDGENPRFDSDHDTANKASWEMDIYKGRPHYEIAKRFVAEKWEPQNIIDALDDAMHLGLGGPGQRAYKKWEDVVNAAGDEKYVICNADESEPGTFKDRDILLAAPHLVVEGMILGALVVGAKKGWIYIRHEYYEQIERCRQEIQTAKTMLPSVFLNFDMDVFPSPGGYICGEQTALIEAMEDRRAEPRNRPPQIMTNGYKNKPTLLSNVETFSWVPLIAEHWSTSGFVAKQRHWRDEEKRLISEQKQKGVENPRIDLARIPADPLPKRLFSISGDVAQPGVYEVETSITLGELIGNYAGGMRDNKSIAAVALSGPSGGVLPSVIPAKSLNGGRFPDNDLDVRKLQLDIGAARRGGYVLGAGIVIYGSGCNVLAEVVANSRFYRNETCGKCVPCRVGSYKITEMAERLYNGEVAKAELTGFGDIVRDLNDVMAETSICGLGQVASKPFASLLKFFPDVAEAACEDRTER
ncbi:MAG: NAD(P)H-dependent oxidoreductase subunit E [Planctomycetales bacterium]|nr:NAD(P)H-dependent oxidoreductase subunit E [Planctomycetales bacterium]